jgi:predicted small lipoprotein YifL
MKLSKTGKTIASALLVSALLIPLSACEKKGPLEEAGEAIDETVEDAGDAIEDATDGD